MLFLSDVYICFSYLLLLLFVVVVQWLSPTLPPHGLQHARLLCLFFFLKIICQFSLLKFPFPNETKQKVHIFLETNNEYLFSSTIIKQTEILLKTANLKFALKIPMWWWWFNC